MANTVEYHAKLMIGDLLLQIAALRAEIEALREQVPQPPKDEPKA